MTRRSRMQGFTLIELLSVIILLGVISIFTFQYLAVGTRIFTDTLGRDELVTQSRFVVERLSRELRNALPASVRVNSDGSCIEFVPIVTVSFYESAPIESEGDPIVAINPVIEGATAGVGHRLTGKHVYVYAPYENNVYEPDDIKRYRQVIQGVTEPDSSNLVEIDLGEHAQFQTASPARRFYITEQPVSWCAIGTQIVRYSGYGFSSVLSTTHLGGSKAVMSDVLVASSTGSSSGTFVMNNALSRNSLVQFNFHFGRKEGEESLHIKHEVFIPNVP